jgi:hypothetical protein
MTDILTIILISGGIISIILFIFLIIWAEREMKKHPELIGKPTEI